MWYNIPGYAIFTTQTTTTTTTTRTTTTEEAVVEDGPSFGDGRYNLGMYAGNGLMESIAQTIEDSLADDALLEADRRRFFGETHFCTTNLRIWYFLGQKISIHFVAKETGIIRKLFI